MNEIEQNDLARLISQIVCEQTKAGGKALDMGNSPYQKMTPDEKKTEAAAQKSVLTLEMAKKLLACGEEKAAVIGVPMVITLVDDGGNVKAQHRMDGSLLASIAISAEKAFTAAALQSSTEEAAGTILPGQPLYGLQNTHPGKFCLFGGGIPLFHRESCVGAVGVSGGTVEQDVTVAEWIACRARELGLC